MGFWIFCLIFWGKKSLKLWILTTKRKKYSKRILTSHMWPSSSSVQELHNLSCFFKETQTGGFVFFFIPYANTRWSRQYVWDSEFLRSCAPTRGAAVRLRRSAKSSFIIGLVEQPLIRSHPVQIIPPRAKTVDLIESYNWSANLLAYGVKSKC